MEPSNSTPTYKVPLLSLPCTQQLHHTARLYLQGYPTTAAVLREKLEKTLCTTVHSSTSQKTAALDIHCHDICMWNNDRQKITYTLTARIKSSVK